jgi:WW domain-containing oxidoreductase
MSIAGLFKGKGPNGFGFSSTAEEVTEGVDLSGKTFLLTGCNSGIGLETLRVLGLRGAYVIAAARTKESANDALQRTHTSGVPVACELSEPASVRACVAAVKETGRKLDGIIRNAGIMALPKLETKHGLELQLLTNHVGHFILVTSLLDRIADDGRVVVVSSRAHYNAPREGIQLDNLDGSKGYTPWAAYGQSKLANILFAKGLAKRFVGTKKTANALHPGVIHTNLARHMNPLINFAWFIAGPIMMKSIPQGAATTCYLAAHPDGAKTSGEYFDDCNPGKHTRPARDEAMAEKLWVTTEALVARL